MTDLPSSTDSPPLAREKRKPRLGLALGSGAARGWAHVGAIRALDELGVEVDVYAGCSVGALVGAARLLDIWEPFLDWARRIGPMEAFNAFALKMARGGLIDPEKAFSLFAEHDRAIETLKAPFGAVATDLATGREVWLTNGSVLDACRASSAVPLVFQAARVEMTGQDHWLIDGGAANPVPTNLARALGADRVIAIDLNGVTLALKRFDRPDTRAVVAVEEAEVDENAPRALAPVAKFIDQAKRDVTQRIALARAVAGAEPQFLETFAATVDIIQGQLAQARAMVDIADLRLTPDLSCGSAAAFDKWEAFEEIGYAIAMDHKDQILSLAEH